MVRPRGPKPKKPRKDFPLFAHASGTWAKTINGRHVHFGPWSDAAGAEERWKEHERARKLGMAPRPAADGSIKLKPLLNRYLTWQHGRLESGDISIRSFKDIKAAVEDFVDEVGRDVAVGDLRPEHFAGYRETLAKRLGYHALLRTITLVKGMMKFAYESDFIDRPVKYGQAFDPPPKAAGRKAKKVRLFSPDEVRRLIDSADAPLKAMILLGINCGFGNTDIGTLPMHAIDFKANVIDFARTKTGIARRCTLWPETVTALKEALKERPKPLDEEHAHLAFITRWGAPFVREREKRLGGAVVGMVATDSVSLLFGQLMGKLGYWKPSDKAKGKARTWYISDGRNFYTLRRTHRTWTSEAGDREVADYLMGHQTPGMGAEYVQHIGDARLKAVTDKLRSKVFTS